MKKIYRYHFFLLPIFTIATSCSGQPAVIEDSRNSSVQRLSDSAHVYEKQGNKKAALQYHKRALNAYENAGMPQQEAQTLVKIALLLKNEDVEASLQHLKEALEIAQRIGHQKLKADILLAMAENYKQQENYREALAALEAHQKLLQTTFSRNKAREIAHIKVVESAKLERYIFLTAIVFILFIAIAMAVYFARTNKLNKELLASNQVKNKLFSIIGHDLRGPASGIMEALNMIDSGILNEAEQKEVIGLLKKQSRSFNETLNSLLSWAATQLQGAEIQQVRFDVKGIMQKSLDVLEGQAKQKHITIHNQIPDRLFVLADMNHVDFVIRNLLSNAIKFSYENGNIELAGSENDDQVVISVSDHGTGIPAAKQKFFSVSSTYMESSFGTKGESGTGLGLMLSKEFIQANNGRMWMESQEGDGTTVFVALKSS